MTSFLKGLWNKLFKKKEPEIGELKMAEGFLLVYNGSYWEAIEFFMTYSGKKIEVKSP